ncbi:peptide ABC transporter substrate-binding protein [Grimontia kaedaensis]|uniref:Peptide ABC transporter substrate-binding protein n=1 Tax=Grimontia kaedaensis TaxID=2872157 RepID=A0ABY4WPV2_9GAMM|nr:peptide ABC transporter substrate-binding protein [Grimontia kaedaensis]USH01212.1 peptide ABC transporter substrate-binding protein [Grimontia kaedaensis]
MKKTILAMAMAAPLALSAASANAETLKIGMSQYPEGLHPTLVSNVAASYILSTSYRKSVIYGKDWLLQCNTCVEVPTFENGLAERITLDDGREGIKMTVAIKDDLFWGDGTPVTTKDILLGYNISVDERVGNPGLQEAKTVEKVVALDDKNFEVYLNKVTFKYNTFVPDALPAHIDGPLYEQDPASYQKTTKYSTDPTNPGLYFGPYVLSKVNAGSFITATPNPNWKGKAPSFDELIFKTVGNTAALEAHLMSGSVDYLPGELGLSLDQVQQLEKRHGGKFNVHYEPGLLYEHLDTTMDNPHLAKKEVRQALLYGANRQQLVDKLFGGKQPVANTNVSPRDTTYYADVKSYEYNPEKAKELLKQAGYTLKKGVMVDGEGNELHLELMTTAGNKTRELVQQVLQSQWKQIGVKVSIVNQPARVYFGETLNQRKHKGLAMFAWYSSPESPPRTTLLSTNIPTEENGWSGQNYIGYKNPAMDELLNKVEKELDTEKRNQIFHEIQKIYAEDLPALPLYFRSDSFVKPKWLEGVTPTGHMFPSSNWVEEWHSTKK